LSKQGLLGDSRLVKPLLGKRHNKHATHRSSKETDQYIQLHAFSFLFTLFNIGKQFYLAITLSAVTKFSAAILHMPKSSND